MELISYTKEGGELFPPQKKKKIRKGIPVRFTNKVTCGLKL